LQHEAEMTATDIFGPIRKLILFKTLSNIFITQIRIFKVKLSQMKTSVNATRKQILRHVTDLWGEVVDMHITHIYRHNNKRGSWTILFSRFSRSIM